MTEENKSVKKFPNLRFPEFEGEWKEEILSDLGTFSGGGTPTSSNENFWNGNIPWISSSDLEEGNILKINISRFITQDAIEKSSTKLCKAPSILIVSRVGVGKVALSLNDVCTSQDFTNISELKCDQLYLAFQLSKVMKKSANEAQGTSIKGISSSEIKSKKIFLPPIIEQEKIASFLENIEERIQTQKKIIEKLETLMKGSREKIFSQKLRFKKEKGSDFPTWERKKIKEILTIGSGKDYKHLNDGTIPVYGTGGVIAFVDSFLYDGATVCIGRKGTIDKPLYYNGKIWTVDTLFYTHSFNNSVPKFVFNVFQNINWKEYNEASGVPSLSKNTIENIEISIPCLEEQYKIINFLSSIQDKVETEKQILEKLELHKKFLLGNLFV